MMMVDGSLPVLLLLLLLFLGAAAASPADRQPTLAASPEHFRGRKATVEVKWAGVQPAKSFAEKPLDIVAIYAPPGRMDTEPLGIHVVGDAERVKADGQAVYGVLNMRSGVEFRYIRLFGGFHFPNDTLSSSPVDSEAVRHFFAERRLEELAQQQRERQQDNKKTGRGGAPSPTRNGAAPHFEVLATSNAVTPLEPELPMHGRLQPMASVREMRVMWVSSQTQGTARVRYGESRDALTRTVQGTSDTYHRDDMCGLWAATNFIPAGYIHDAVMTDLEPGRTYFYQYGSYASWSEVRSFKAPQPVGADTSTRLLLYGDLGTSECDGISGWCEEGAAETFVLLKKELASRAYDMIAHIGDISYAVGHAVRWEQFAYQLEPIATQVPYAVLIGNHEFDWAEQAFQPSWANYYNDSHGECGVPYSKRFHMPSAARVQHSLATASAAATPGRRAIRNLWYSVDVGNVHMVFISTEHNFTTGSEQFAWIDRDLASVDRARTPWVIVMGHRPMYSSADYAPEQRMGSGIRQYLEPVLVKYKVDLALWAHVHVYEATCPVIAEKVVGSCEPPFVNPKAPIHAVIGMAGCELTPQFQYPQPSWSRFRLAEFGYTRAYAPNATHFQLEFVTNRDASVHDSFWITRK